MSVFKNICANVAVQTKDLWARQKESREFLGAITSFGVGAAIGAMHMTGVRPASPIDFAVGMSLGQVLPVAGIAALTAVEGALLGTFAAASTKFKEVVQIDPVKDTTEVKKPKIG